MTPQARPSTIAKARPIQSTLVWILTKNAPYAGIARRASVPHIAIAMPSSEPSSARTMFSTINCRMTRHGPAPMARRTPISL
jgi:hypothetical protein